LTNRLIEALGEGDALLLAPAPAPPLPLEALLGRLEGACETAPGQQGIQGLRSEERTERAKRTARTTSDVTVVVAVVADAPLGTSTAREETATNAAAVTGLLLLLLLLLLLFLTANHTGKEPRLPRHRLHGRVQAEPPLREGAREMLHEQSYQAPIEHAAMEPSPLKRCLTHDFRCGSDRATGRRRLCSQFFSRRRLPGHLFRLRVPVIRAAIVRDYGLPRAIDYGVGSD
jgi:hypothetical protein